MICPHCKKKFEAKDAREKPGRKSTLLPEREVKKLLKEPGNSTTDKSLKMNVRARAWWESARKLKKLRREE